MRTLARRLGYAVLGLVTCLLVVAAGVWLRFGSRLTAQVPVPTHAFAASSLVGADTAAALVRGKYLAVTRGCIDCHGADFGGAKVVEDPMVGRIFGVNLTGGRAAGPLTDAEFELAVRHGVRADGSKLVLMPATDYEGMSDEDLAIIATYIRSLPSKSGMTPPISVALPMRALQLAGKANLLAAERVTQGASHLRQITAAPTAEYGRYLVAGCTGCHGTKLLGGPIAGGPPDWPPAANLTTIVARGYTGELFARALRTGVRADGSALRPPMTGPALAALDSMELAALWEYLKTVQASGGVGGAAGR